MAGKQDSLSSAKQAHSQRTTITLPPRPLGDTFFTDSSFSPGPMTLLSSFYSPDSYLDSNYNSFSQLLAMASPRPQLYGDVSNSAYGNMNMSNTAISGDGVGESGDGVNKSGDGNENLGFKQSRPMSLMVARSPLFTVPPGLSPSSLFSPGFFSPQSPFGMSHQQALAQVTAQAAFAAQTQMQMHSQLPSSAVSNDVVVHQPSMPSTEISQQLVLPSTSDSQSSLLEQSDHTQLDKKPQPPPGFDRPNDDGYNWRKYGQKPIKGSEYPRSYYKCTHSGCPVKKKIERSNEGQITEIIYKSQHNHDRPLQAKRSKEGADVNGSELVVLGAKTSKAGSTYSSHGRDWEPTLSDAMERHASSDSEEAADAGTRGDDAADDEPNPKRRNVDVGPSEASLSQKTVTEPKIIVQTRSEVDLLDDGYKWRKYGQKVVKGNPHPRSYYKCTSAGCNVRKHVERAAADPKAVITTYEGKHNHDVPGGRSNNGGSSYNNASQLKPRKVVAENRQLHNGADFGSDDQKPILLRLKEEKVAV